MNLERKKTIMKLLHEAIEMQIILTRKNDWNTELLEQSTPILWFGNIESEKSKIVTIGANPSRSEFLAMNKTQVENALNVTGDHSLFKYLEHPKNRFKVLKSNSTLENILNDEKINDEIIEGYNNYFEKKPYKIWFGSKNGYKLEGFINGLGASFYDNKTKEKRCIHLDMFPFATLSDFTKIKELAVRDLFNNGWAKEFLVKLIDLVSPETIVVFGASNIKEFKELFEGELNLITKGTYLRENTERRNMPDFVDFDIYSFYNRYKLVFIPPYLGNPRSFNTKDLNDLGNEVYRALKNLD